MLFTSNRLTHLNGRLMAEQPSLESGRARWQYLLHRLDQNLRNHQTWRAKQLTNFGAQLELLCPTFVLKRGYSIVRDSQGKIIVSAVQVSPGQRLDIELSQGHLGVEVMNAG